MTRPSWWLAEDGPADYVLWWVILTLLGFGFIMVYSASTPIAQHETGNPFFFAERQGLYGISEKASASTPKASAASAASGPSV